MTEPAGLLREIEAAALALAETRPKNKHSQLCPVWVQRMRVKRHAVTIADCDCWILRDARQDVSVVHAALAATGDSEGPLDVERLIRAFGNEGVQLHEETWHVNEYDLPDIAAEYARLSSKEAG